MLNLSEAAASVLTDAIQYAKEKGLELITPEVILLSMCKNKTFREAFEDCGGDIRILEEALTTFITENLYSGKGVDPAFSDATTFVLTFANRQASYGDKSVIELTQIVYAFFRLKDSYAVYYIESQDISEVDLLQSLTAVLEEAEGDKSGRSGGSIGRRTGKGPNSEDDLVEDSDEDSDVDPEDGPEERGERRGRGWKQYAPCINDMLANVNPLIGREEELERTIQILCRKDKNNPLHIGEPGVGKTAITYGLARRINEGKVPKLLIGARIFSIDLGGMLAGTHYRGDFEKRFKQVLEGIAKEEKPIIYIDEIHNLHGAGATGESSYDAANLLKPYLADGHIRFIGATTFEEYKNHFEKSKSLVRRFQNVEIREPSQEETVEILRGLKQGYEVFHGVTYSDEILKYMVETSARYINERYLPDKAIDLMDEAGAYRKLHPQTASGKRKKKADPEESTPNAVDKDVVDKVLTSICRVPLESIETDDAAGLANLEENLKSKIFGQDEAVAQVTNAVKFSKAGLLEDGKPLASLLFVGPTGVGKTEIARQLAAEMGVKLIRFDMSEYTEKYSISKLIGASAGYVGYENGGLLTEAVRKSPSAVLLLDEIEKAHDDIYNILLQVMDYATLTDNQGRKADFRNVILIMTSNIGADKVGKSSIGFMSERLDQTVMMDEVKRAFKPEFRNRLSRVVIFRSIDDEMAVRIVDKKLSELGALLIKKGIELEVDEPARALIKQKGVSVEYGAREVERVIRNEIKPLFVDSILFGELKKGGRIRLTAEGESFFVK
ncbi:MAG: ATP-dependent Clp protease ATP-binding subunit [Eubacterium sp.]|nr:ATP-dependent Clp protease ATP-binding subunit [Eubacterium sp.]